MLDEKQIIGTSITSSTKQGIGSYRRGLSGGRHNFPNNSKCDTRQSGIETWRTVRSVSSSTTVAIGGINSANITPVVQTGVDSICVASAITKAGDVGIATTELAELFNKAK
ncbi:MAG TPA: thiamine phosphate synthase [Dehalococcoidia bacterium]|nr:hypothetical protein [Chloroflexota bacterium]HJP27827.1 thiamine phosphate synthase [Dehalococcoidia bacterium]